MSSDTYKNYLRDLGYLVREHALESLGDRDTAKTDEERSFADGCLMGFYQVVSLMQHQAEVFGIPLSELCLDDIDPNKDLC